MNQNKTLCQALVETGWCLYNGMLIVTIDEGEGEEAAVGYHEFVASSAGAQAIVYPVESIDVLNQSFKALKQPCYDGIDFNLSRQTVIMAGPAMRLLSEKERLAVFYHEEGHHKLGHLQRNNSQSMVIEKEADAYAAKKTSKLAMAKGLRNIIVNSAISISFLKMEYEDSVLQNVKKRILALTS